MGMIIAGRWSDEDQIVRDGAFVRPTSVHNKVIDQCVLKAMLEEPGRFHLIGSWTCPWSHRTLILRRLKGLEDIVPLHITGGIRYQGYPANFNLSWKVPGSNRSVLHLHELYAISDENYTGRSTLPILWDSKTQTIVSNESSHIMRAFEIIEVPGEENQVDFLPMNRIETLDAMNDKIYHGLSNGTYKARFAETQQAYDDAVTLVFDTLDELELLLSKQRYLLGDELSEADWRLFPTLVRFDIEYYVHSRCSKKRLIDYPMLWAYARELYAQPGIRETVNFAAIHLGNYDLGEIIPKRPEIDWNEPHHRDKSRFELKPE